MPHGFFCENYHGESQPVRSRLPASASHCSDIRSWKRIYKPADDAAASWISELGARSEALGWRFDLLEVAAGLSVAAFALLLLPRIGVLSPFIRRGLRFLGAAGVAIAVGGAAPLSCAEVLDRACTLEYDGLDILHATANVVAVAGAAIAFALIGLLKLDSGGGARQPGPRPGLAAAGRADRAQKEI